MDKQIAGSFKGLASALGYSTARLLANRVDSDGALVDSLAGVFQRIDARLSNREVKDAATNFTTNHLATVLVPIERTSNERFLFVPGRTGDKRPLLPVAMRAELGARTIEYRVIEHTVEDTFFAPDGLADEREQPIAWFGVKFGWDQFELWHGVLLNRRIETEAQLGARNFMDSGLEITGGFGLPDYKIPGMFNTGSAMTLELPKSLGDPTLTAEEMLGRLADIHAVWKNANPRRRISGVVMPETHWFNMRTVLGEAGSLWAAMGMFPWLANIVEDDRLLGASDTGASMWHMWANHSEEFYLEASPTPMLFGPFENGMTIDFILLNQTAGVINKRPERLMRVQFPE